MPILARRTESFEVPVQEFVVRVAGPAALAEEARAAGMGFLEQVQTYALRHPGFATSRRPVEAPASGGPPAILRLAELTAAAGVGPMFGLRGALVEHIGRSLSPSLREVNVACSSAHWVVPRRRARMSLRAPPATGRPLAIVLDPVHGGQGVHLSGPPRKPSPSGADVLAVVATSAILAEAAGAAAATILAKRASVGVALSYLRGVPGVRGAVVLRDDTVGVTGSVELSG